jgi:hypothetical protein
VPRPQLPVPGAQVGTGKALVFVVEAGAFAYELAIAPVTARATTRLRTISFMVLLLSGPGNFWCRVENFSGRARWNNLRMSILVSL